MLDESDEVSIASNSPLANAGAKPWLTVLRRYFLVIALGNLAWEFAHLPLYTIWREGTPGGIVFAAAHCAGGDLLIAASSLLGALLIAGNAHWPYRRYREIAVMTIVAGVAYTIFSEWLNVSVRRSWAYSAWMPVIPTGAMDIGVSPLLQWIVVPTAAFWMARAEAPRLAS